MDVRFNRCLNAVMGVVGVMWTLQRLWVFLQR